MIPALKEEITGWVPLRVSGSWGLGVLYMALFGDPLPRVALGKLRVLSLQDWCAYIWESYPQIFQNPFIKECTSNHIRHPTHIKDIFLKQRILENPGLSVCVELCTTGASITTNTILVVPYYNYSIMGPNTLF